MGLSRCFATIEETDTTSKLAAAASPTTTKAVWFPTRIQDALDDYHTTVQRLFVRHIVTETQSMAQWALQQSTQYSTISSNGLASDEQSSTATKFRADPFGATAAALSACLATREDGGTIGWVERPDSLLLTESAVPSSILSSNVINDLFQLQPKAGDVYTLEDELEQRWHVIQVAEIWMNRTVATTKRQQSMLVSESLSVPTDNRLTVVPGAIGHYQGANVVVPRRQLKGHGVRPLFPEQLSTFHIQTAGCQMNVADSERLAGILQNDLQLQVSNEPTQADVVLFNTCSIRDHAEQKLYDVLGPYAAAKRQGKKRMVLVVTGCVAQQEGEALVRRVPEIDIVLGPQYIPHFQNILEQILEHGNPVVATAPMLLPEHNDNAGLFNKPVRGHDVRAWVNVIHGCNEHCTYCVVPATRGMEQSRTPESIYRECLALGEAGYKEVTLLGQNIDAYGRDMIPKRTFAGLLEYLNANLPDKMRIRYASTIKICSFHAYRLPSL